MGSSPGLGTDLPAHVQELCTRAMEGAGVAMFVTGPRADEMPIVWVNAAFVRQTGFTAAEVVGRSPHVLETLLAEPVDAQELRAAIAEEREITHTVRALRRDGDTVWTQLSLSPLAGPDGSVTHWVGVQVDVSEHLERYAAQVASLALERRERAVLDVVSRSSDLLADLDQPYALRDITELLAGYVVDWAGFYLNDDGLRYAEGVDTAAPPTGRGQRHGRYTPGLFPLPTGAHATDALGDSAAVTGSVPRVRLVDVPDRVQDVLDGRIEGPVTLDLSATYPQWSASGWLQRDLHHRLSGLQERPGSVTVSAVPGRRRILGLLVTGDSGGSSGQGLGHGPDAEGRDGVRTLLQVIARRAGTAIDNVRLYAREHRLAETLQRAMLPEQADVTGLDVWTYYAPNSEHAQVGGDWYDVLQIAPDVVGLVIGDVVGHDVEAAAAMGQLRSVVRSYAYELTTPGPVLERVDQLVQGMRIPRSASLVYAALTQPDAEQPDDAWRIEYSRAGHLPPLLLRDGTVTQLDDAGGALVGFGGRSRSTGVATLAPGDTLVFYTDGLIERRDRALRVGLESLVAASAAVTAVDAAGVGEELLSRLADAPEDDVALVVVRIPDPVHDASAVVLSPRSRRWLLPSEPASIGRARHAVVRTCQAWGVRDSANAELVVSELVANGVLHGWGHLALRLFDTGDGIRVEVEDSNPAPPVPTDGHPNRMGGFGMQIVERLADWGWRPTASGKLVWAKLRPSDR
ncbi:SpoIIE family protein phosphatase [Cellulosimicrobium protaetiae]|uniref:SpoIIE family protein phosphatase n=1 Tax=Cellulosimicrobium protaetiae TaxID=2587808 RepID=A0A6M5UIS4_9MICO|nr:SpoIIE family protein phosphatase [Cellulosimicrobium protaetiae]QJW37954.1 SpoIIE family protein phosphatase [Cellulosimicrobium protaetiae]